MVAAATTARLRRALASATGGGGARLRRALRGGTSLALLAALAAPACDTDTIDLLPMEAMASVAGSMTAGASAALPIQGGSSSAGGGASGSGGSASSGSPADDDESHGGASDGGGSSFGGRSPIGAGGNFGWPYPCVPGTPFCSCSGDDCQPGWHCQHTELGGVCLQQCGGREPCKLGYGCDASRQRCEPSCDTDQRCDFGRVCDVAQLVCVQCVGDIDCDDDKEPEANFCDEHRCVECRDEWDCDRGGPLPACLNGRCSECASSADCGPDRDCDTARGRCY